MIAAEWLQAKLAGKTGETDPSTSALLSDFAKNTEQVLALRVNELLEGRNGHFAEAHRSLVEQALKAAREKVQSAELEKCTAEAEFTRYRDQVKGQIDVKIREIEEKMKRAASQLAAAGRRATAAEERATKAEATVKRLEQELQSLRMRTSARLVRTAA